MGDSSSSSSRRRQCSFASRHRERDSASDMVYRAAHSPPSYTVEENSKGEWINSRLNVKWPQRVSKHSTVKSLHSTRDTDACRPSKRDSLINRCDATGGRVRSGKDNEGNYIYLGSQSDEADGSAVLDYPKTHRMVVKTSPTTSQTSVRSLGRYPAVDSVVFDTRSELIRHHQANDDKQQWRRREEQRPAPIVTETEEFDRLYVGVRSRRSVEKKLTTPGEFVLYYQKPREGVLPVTIDLHLAYLSTGRTVYHFPIHCLENTAREKHYVVMQNKNDGKMFPSILSLVKFYSLYANVDPATGHLEAFAVPH